jgi:hypothetical protein
MRGRVYFIRINRKMHQRALLELKQRRRGIAIFAILLHRVAPILAGAGILQLASRHRQSIQRQQHVHRIMFSGVTGNLPRHRQLVFIEQRENVIVQPMRRFEISKTKSFAIKLEAVPQNVQRAFQLQLFDQRVDEQTFQPRAVQAAHLLPKFGLRVLQKSEDTARKQRGFHVPFRQRTGLPAGLIEQNGFDVSFESFFGGLGHV